MAKIDNRDLQRSHLAERKSYANPGAGDAPGAQVITLVDVHTDDGSAQPWRIFLGRLDRQDQHAPLNQGAGDPFQSEAAWPSQQFSYAAGLQRAPAIPPRRSNPVWGLNFPSNEAALIPTPFVEISWGMNTAFPQRMVAHWPAQGGSIVVTGSYVQVWAGVALYNAGGAPEFSTPVAPSEWPMFQAQITPESSLAPRDAAELSLTQRLDVPPFVPAVPPVEGEQATAAAADFTVPIPVNGGSGFWDGSFLMGAAAFGAAGNGWVLKIWVQNTGVTAVDARINEEPQTGGVWVPSPNTIGLRCTGAFGTGPDPTVIAAALALIGVIYTPVAPWAFVLTSMGANFGSQLTFAGGTDGSAGVPARVGGAVYVPDFARRVRVVLTSQPTCAGEPVVPGLDLPMVPPTGDPPCQLAWYDDTGATIDAAIQGVGVSTPPQWHPVPAGATMLGIYQAGGWCGGACAEVTMRVTMAPGDPFDPPVVITVDNCTITAHVRGVPGEVPVVTYPSLQTLIDELVAAGIGAAATGDAASAMVGPQIGDPLWEYAGTLACVDGSLTTLDALTEFPPTPASVGAPDPITVASGPLEAFTIGGEAWEGCAGEPAITYQGLVHWRIAP